MDGEHANCGVDGVIITGDLDRRPSRAPDYEAETRALASLAETMSSNPATVLQRLVEAVTELTRSDSAGISLLEPGGEQGTFRWVATAGAWAPYRDGTMPQQESPCGEVVARETVLLVDRPERAFPALLQAQPGIGEGLLAPFNIAGVPGGTVWAIMHGRERRFEAEDARLLKSLARFASIAHQMVLSLRTAEAGRLESDIRLRALARASSDVFFIMSPDMSELRELSGGDFIDDTTSPSRAWLRDYIPPEDHARTTAAISEAIRTKGVFDLEHRVRRVDGSVGWALSRAVPMLGTDGEIVEWFGAANDITARKRAEEVAHRSEERQTFLLALNDALRPLADPKDIQRAATHVLGQHLKASRVAYAQITDDEYIIEGDYVDGVSSMASRYRIDTFGQNKVAAYEEGVTRVIPDAASDVFNDPAAVANLASLGVRAGIGVPLFKAGRMVATLVVHQREPRNWTRQDVVLAEETAERTWAAIERARAEAALRESEEKYRTLFENLGQGYAECELIRNVEGRVTDFRYIALNPAFERLTGFKVAEVLGRTAREAVPDIADTHFEMYERIVKAGVPSRREYRIDALDRWYENHVYPSKGDRFFALYEDITERKRADAALRESEAILAAAFESVPVGAAVLDQSGKIVLANAEYRHFLPTGVMPSRDPVRGNRWRGWNAEGTPLDPTDFPGARAMRGERVVPGQEMLYTDDDGREIWTSVATVPIQKDGQATGLISVISDIDALRRSTQALRDSEARFRQFSDASTNVLWIRDAVTLRMIFASPAFDTIYGIPGPDRGGDGSLRAWARLIEPENRKTVLTNFRRVRAGERVEMEFQFRRASDGALRWAHNTDFPLRDAAGVVRWIAGLGADMTDAKEAADRQGVLVAELQHRTRNLIAVVRSLSDRTLANATSLEDFGKRFRLRLSALSRVQGLLSHLAAGERVTFDELLRSELTAHGATDGVASKVTLDGPAGVPLRSGTVQTFALALHELATNAVKYGALAAPDGHLTVRWHVEAPLGNDPPRLHVEWRESGVVMPDVGAAPRGGGYGRELIERALPYQLKAKTSYELGADGVRCTIAVPISRTAVEGVLSRE